MDLLLVVGSYNFIFIASRCVLNITGSTGEPRARQSVPHFPINVLDIAR